MSNIFDRSFRFYESGAPFPGVCIACSNTTKLWDLALIPGTNRRAYLCDKDLQDLALYAGFVLKSTHESTVNELTAENEALSKKIEVAPALIKELTADVNVLLTHFVAELASVASAHQPVQSKGNQTNSGIAAESAGAEQPVGEAKGQNPKPSAKPSSK